MTKEVTLARAKARVALSLDEFFQHGRYPEGLQTTLAVEAAAIDSSGGFETSTLVEQETTAPRVDESGAGQPLHTVFVAEVGQGVLPPQPLRQLPAAGFHDFAESVNGGK